MRDLTRRDVLKAGSTAAMTAMLNPLLPHTGSDTAARPATPEPPTLPADDLCFTDATVLAQLMRAKKVSSVEVMKAH